MAADRGRASGRVAAWIALLAFGIGVAAVALLFVRNPLAVPIALGAVFVAGAAAWIALTRRGAIRAVAAVAVVCALVGGASVIVTLGAGAELLVVAGAALFCIAATRSALRQALRAQPDATRPEVDGAARASRATRRVLLMNPKSGGGKVERFDLVDEARLRGIEPIVLRPGDDLEALARKAIGSADVIGMAGGDGSQALVAGVAMEHDVPYVCVPAGTRNHLALDLGLDPDDVVGSLDAFVDGTERRVDLGLVNGGIFVNNVSLGIYAQIVQSEEYRDAKLRTMERKLPELLGPDAKPFDLRFREPVSGAERSAQLVLVSNNRYTLERLAAIGSRSRLDGGELGIVAVEITSAAKAAELISLEAVGQVRRFSGWLEWSASEFTVWSGAQVAAGVDGEALRLEPPLTFRIASLALCVRLPAAVAGLSRAAVTPRLTPGALRELARIAAHR
jgi:diacylglycerol kinase family enzyme